MNWTTCAGIAGVLGPSTRLLTPPPRPRLVDRLGAVMTPHTLQRQNRSNFPATAAAVRHAEPSSSTRRVDSPDGRVVRSPRRISSRQAGPIVRQPCFERDPGRPGTRGPWPCGDIGAAGKPVSPVSRPGEFTGRRASGTRFHHELGHRGRRRGLLMPRPVLRADWRRGTAGFGVRV